MKLPHFFPQTKYSRYFKQLKWNSGVTLVELLIYMGLLAGFVVIISGVFVAMLDSKTQIIDSSTLNQDNTYILQRLQYDISRASAITTPATNGTTTSNLVLTVPEGTLTYSVTNEQLNLTKTTALSFKRLGNTDGMSTITISLALESLSTSESLVATHSVGTR
jgi:hypothetical protein